MEEHVRVDYQGADQDNYWQSVLTMGVVFSVAGFLISILFGYMQIASEPTGAIMTPMMTGGVVVCLATCFGGLAAVWHMTRYVTPYLSFGRGALIGFFTGAVIVIVNTVLNELWLMVDPTYTEQLLESVVANVDEMDLPADAREGMIDQMAAGIQQQSMFQQIFYGIPVTGLLNLVTGLLGIKYFADQKPQESVEVTAD